MDSQSCGYRYVAGDSCPGECYQGSPFCIWHSPNAPRGRLTLQAELAAWIEAGHHLEGMILREADLSGFAFWDKRRPEGLNCMGIDAHRTNLQDAHLYRANLQGASLWGASLHGANLNRVNLVDANLLGVDWDGARLEHITWGKAVLQESEAQYYQKQGRYLEASQHFEEAEEVYRSLYKAADDVGLMEEASHFYLKEKLMNRANLSPRQKAWWVSSAVGLSCGYGERPSRVIALSSLVVLMFALGYALTGVKAPEGILVWDHSQSLGDRLSVFWSLVYFSIVTFTTLGFGEMYPIGWSRLLACAEAFMGAFMIAVFVVVFVRKMMR